MAAQKKVQADAVEIGKAKVTSKGQITVPGSVRDQLNLVAGDHLEFIRTATGRIEVRTRKRKSILDVAAKFQLRAPKGAGTTDEMIDRAITEAMAERELRSRGPARK